MLTAIRDRATGWIAWAIVIIITIPFALWGVNSYLDGLNEVIVADVNGESINYETYSRSLDQRRSYFQRNFGNQFDADYFATPEFRAQTVEGLVEERLLNQEVDALGLRIGDAQLNNLIQQTPQFQGADGRFDQALYQRALAGSGYTTQGFEQAQRRQNELAQLRNGLSASAFVVPSRLDSVLQLVEQQRKARFVTISAEKFVDTVEVSDDAVEKAYNDSPDAYMAPERMKVEYIRISVANMAEKFDVTDDDVATIYEQTRNSFGLPERRKTQHILVKVDPENEDGAAAEKEALDKITALAERVKGGEDFSEVAKAESQDIGSKRKGGELGFVGRGQSGIAPEFETALFALEKEGVSEPVRTEYGFHLIRVADIEAERIKALEEVAEEIRTAEQRKLAESEFVDMQEILSNLAYEQPDTLAPAAEELGLEIEQSDWIERQSGEGVFAADIVRRAAFSDVVLKEDLNSDVIQADVDTIVALRKFEHEPVTRRSLDDVKDQIIAELKNQAAADKAKEVGENLVATLTAAGDPLAALTEELATLELEAVELPASRTEARTASYEVAQVVYEAPRPSDDKPVIDGVSLNNGDFAAYLLESVTDADATTVADEQRTRYESVLERRSGDDSFSSYQTGLRDNADVSIREDSLY